MVLEHFINGENILEDLFSSYNYYKSPMLNHGIFSSIKMNLMIL